MNIKKLFGFTLAEILLAMTIIGVIAAMTMPALVSNFNDKIYTTQIKKTYGEIDSVIQRFMSDKKVESLRELNATKQQIADELATKYFDVVLDCGGESAVTGGCFEGAGKYKRYDKTVITVDTGIRVHKGSCTKVVLLSTGAALCITAAGLADERISFEIDVNGTKSPNTAGKDLFTIAVTDSGNLRDPNCGLAMAGSPAPPCPCSATSYSVKDGSGFLNKLIINGWNMDYKGCTGVN